MLLGSVGLGEFVAETAPQIVPSFMEGVGSGVHNVWSAFAAPPPGKPAENQPEIQLPYEFIHCFGVLHYDDWAPSHHSKDDGALHNRLMTFMESGSIWFLLVYKLLVDHLSLLSRLTVHPDTCNSGQFPDQPLQWWQERSTTISVFTEVVLPSPLQEADH